MGLLNARPERRYKTEWKLTHKCRNQEVAEEDEVSERSFYSLCQTGLCPFEEHC